MPDSLAYDHPTSQHAPQSPGEGEPAVDAVLEELAQLAPEEELAKKLYPEKPAPQGAPPEAIPENIKNLRKEDEARQMFNAQSTYGDVPLEDVFAKVEGFGGEEKAAAAHEYREIFADFELSGPEAKEFLSLAQELHADMPTAETEVAWQNQAVKRLVEVHGDGAAAAVDLAKQLVARDPRIGAILEATRLGSHPRVIELVVEIAQRQKLRGRL